jgi:hypothetical protein
LVGKETSKKRKRWALDEAETDEKSARKENPLYQMRGGGKTLKRRGSIWSVGSERDDEKRERER